MNIGLAAKVDQNVLLKVKNIRKVFLLFQFYAINYEKAFRDLGSGFVLNMSTWRNMNYEKIKKEIKEFVDERDWDQFHTPKNLSMALSVEASELLEIFQWQKADEFKSATEKQKEMIKDEIADIFYYLVRISEKLNINIEEALLNKMKKNKEKYPKESVKGKAIKN